MECMSEWKQRIFALSHSTFPSRVQEVCMIGYMIGYDNVDTFLFSQSRSECLREIVCDSRLKINCTKSHSAPSAISLHSFSHK